MMEKEKREEIDENTVNVKNMRNKRYFYHQTDSSFEINTRVLSLKMANLFLSTFFIAKVKHKQDNQYSLPQKHLS